MIIDIDPTVDYAFKHLFGRDQTGPILVDVIDSVLAPAPEHRISDLDLLNPFNPKEALDDKLSILDIKARDRTGRQFNVEMQLLAYRYYEKRILYYWARLHQQQLHENHFDQLSESRALPASCGLSSVFSAGGAKTRVSLDARYRVPHSRAFEVYKDGRGVGEQSGDLALLFPSCGEDGYGSS